MEASYGITALSTNGYPIEVMNEVNVNWLCRICNVTLNNPAQLFWLQTLQRMFRTQNEDHLMNQHEIPPARSTSIATD